MTEQQREAFEAWYNAEYVRPIIPADRTEGGYQHPDAQAAWDAWQAALSYAEGEAHQGAVGWMCVDENGVRDGEIVTHRSELDEDDWRPGFRAVPVYTHPAPQVAVPETVLALVRFLAQTWDAVDRFVYENCDGDALMHYPVVQGTRNQLNLRAIGEQPFDPALLRAGVEFMLAAAPTAPAGEPKHKPTPLHGPHGTIAYTADGHPASGSDQQPVSDPDGLAEATRQLLERLYGTLERSTPPADEPPNDAVSAAMLLLNEFLSRFPGALDAPEKEKAAPDERETRIGWIDVADRKPDEAQEVLFVRGEKVLFGAWIGGIFWHNNEKMAACKWMPIPSVDLDYLPDEREIAERTCEWSTDDEWDGDNWESECGASWTFPDGGPVENQMKHCPECGLKVRLRAGKGDE